MKLKNNTIYLGVCCMKRIGKKSLSCLMFVLLIGCSTFYSVAIYNENNGIAAEGPSSVNPDSNIKANLGENIVDYLNSVEETEVLYLEGTPEERGITHGTECKEGIQQNLNTFWSKVYKAGHSREEVIELVKRIENIHKQDDPDNFIEIAGIAKGAEVLYEDLLAFNLYPVYLYEDPSLEHGCTGWVAHGTSTSNGNTLMHKNRDLSRDAQVVVKVAASGSDNGYIGVVTSGATGITFGINDLGLSLGNTYVDCTEINIFGKGSLTMTKEMLKECDEVDHVFTYLAGVNPSAGSNQLCADPNKVAIIEYTAQRYTTPAQSIIQNGVGYRSNYFTILTGYNSNGVPSTTQIIRYNAARDFVNAHNGSLTAGDFNVPSRHHYEPTAGYPSEHDGVDGSISNYHTLSAGTFEIDTEYPEYLSVMWTAIGTPCSALYTPIHIGSSSVNSHYTSSDAWNLAEDILDQQDADVFPFGSLVSHYLEYEADMMVEEAGVISTARAFLDIAQVSNAQSALTTFDDDCGDDVYAEMTRIYDKKFWEDSFHYLNGIDSSTNLDWSDDDEEVMLDSGDTSGSVRSVTITHGSNWNQYYFQADHTLPGGTDISYSIRDSSNTLLTSVTAAQAASGYALSAIAPTTIKLQADLSSSSGSITPLLHDWSVFWASTPPDLLPDAEFTANSTSINEGDSILFTFTGSEGDAPATYSWNFGDTGTSTDQNPTYQYTSSGTYTVSLNVSDNDSDEDIETKTSYITVNADINPVADFTADSTYISESDSVDFTFTGNPGNTPSTYSWNFGDTGTSTDQNPTHQYTTAGDYTVTLTVTDRESDEDTEIKTDYITVVESSLPVAEFIVNQTTIIGDNSVAFNFTGSPGNPPSTYLWDFGDAEDPVKTYDFTSITAAHSTINAYENDVDIFPFGGNSDNRNDHAEPTNAEYIAISASDNSRWQTDDPGDSDEMMLWFEMVIDDDVADIQSIDFVFEGYSASTPANGQGYFYMYLLEDGADWTQDASWDQLGTSMYIPYSTDQTMTRTLSSDFSTYISSSGAINWMVGTPEGHSDEIYCDYIKMDVTMDVTDPQANVQNATHQYTEPGTYTVSLTVTDDDSEEDTETKTDYITVVEDLTPVADFTASRFSINEGESINFYFTGSEGNSPATYLWNFGDTGTSTDQNPSHQYNTAGTYTVNLTVSDLNNDEDVEIKTNYITVLSDISPVADFTANTTTVIAGQCVAFTFTGSEGNAPTTYIWDFGDLWEDGDNSSLANPIHFYNTSGTYTVNLTVVDEDEDMDIESKTNYITVLPDLSPVADFTANTTSITAGEFINFTFNGLKGNPTTTYSWNFGDTGTSSEENVTYQYLSAGTYTVTLTITDADNDVDVEVKTNYISVAGNALPNADFTANFTSIIAGQSVSFTFIGSEGDTPTDYLWDFGDTGTSTDQNPTHQYTSDGVYTVNLTVTDDDTDVDIEIKVGYITVAVDLTPIANFTANSTSIIAGQSVEFTFSGYEGNPSATYSWNFGDTGTSTSQNPTHQYTSDGTYTVTLTITDADNDVDPEVKTDYIIVAEDLAPHAYFTADKTNLIVGQSVGFTFTGSEGNPSVTYLWGFGDGYTSTEINPTHQYISAGTYTVNLTITDNDGDSDSDDITNYIIVVEDLKPIADFSVDTTTIMIKDFVVFTFTGSEGNPSATYLWDFGDGGSSSEKNPLHLYSSAGTYTVTLTITDANNDVAIKIKNDYIIVSDGADNNESPIMIIFMIFFGLIFGVVSVGVVMKKRNGRNNLSQILNNLEINNEPSSEPSSEPSAEPSNNSDWEWDEKTFE